MEKTAQRKKNIVKVVVLVSVFLCLNITSYANVDDIQTRKVSIDLKNESITTIIKESSEVIQSSKKIIKVKGRVIDADGKPIPGVTILDVTDKTIKGTISDKQGAFLLRVRENSIIQFSFIGYKRQTITINSKKQVNLIVRLEVDVLEIEGVLVTGYQSLDKRSQAGSMFTLKGKDLFLDPTMTLEQALQGKVPGMIVMNRHGLTGTRQRTRIRGTSTLLGNAEPVWVVDGIIQEDPLPFQTNDFNNINPDNIDMMRDFIGSAISWLNPNDIESITVLKDASSTAIYGVKAANGVIVINTKKGEEGRATVSYSSNFSMTPQMTYNDLELMNSQQRVDVSREAFETNIPLLNGNYNIGYTSLATKFRNGEISIDEFSRESKKLESNNTDWFDILFRNAYSQNHNVSLSGGNEKTTYHSSIGIGETNNSAKGNDQKRLTGSTNVAMKLWDNITLSTSLNASYTSTNAFVGGNPYQYATKINRSIPAYNEDGSNFFYEDRSRNYLFNIENELANTGNKNSLGSINANMSLRAKIYKELSFTTTMGYSYSSVVGESWYTDKSLYIANIRGSNYEQYEEGTPEYGLSKLPLGGLLNQMNNANNSFTWRGQFEYNKIIAKKHYVVILTGVEMRSSTVYGSTQGSYGYLHDKGNIIVNLPMEVPSYLGSSSNVVNQYARTSPKITKSESNYVSYYNTLSYMYDNRFAFNTSIRGDASNRFGQDKSTRFKPVFAFGARWNIGSEHWIKNQNIISDMSLRASYGFQGNVVENASPDLVANIVLNSQSDGYNLTLKDLPAPELKWEKVTNMNIGFDWSFFDNKVRGTFEFYRRYTKDMITSINVPYENGILTRLVNGGDMSNSGWDLSVGFTPYRTQDFAINISASIGRVINKLESTVEASGDWLQMTTGNMHKEGYPVSSFWAFQYDGLNPENGGPQLDYGDLSDVPEDEARRDATLYMAYAGQREPNFTTGINLSIRYKRLSLSTGLYLSTGNQTFLAPPSNSMYTSIPSEYENMSTEWVDRWRKPGDEKFTDVPALPSVAHNAQAQSISDKYINFKLHPYQSYDYSTIRVVDAWFLRCRSISISYIIPDELLKNTFQNMSINCSVSNPFTINSKDFKGRDPEVALGSQPLSTTYTMGLNISF